LNPSTTPTLRSAKPHRRRRWWWVLGTVIVLAVLSVGLYQASPFLIARLAGDLLEEMTGAQVQIDSAQFGPHGSIHLEGLELQVPGVDPLLARVFHADAVVIEHRLPSLLRGRLLPETLTFINPTLFLTEDMATGKYNFQYLQEQRGNNQPAVPRRVPEMFVRGGQVKFGGLDQHQYKPLGSIYLSGNLVSLPDTPRTYVFSLQQHYPDATPDTPEQDGPTLRGRFDLRKLSVSASLDHLRVDPRHRVVLPERLRQWWDLLQPVGDLSTVRFGYDPDPAVGLNAELELSNAQLTWPYGETDARMTGVSGRFAIANDTITIDNLAGQIKGLQYVINGQVQGFSRDAPLELTVQTKLYAITDDPRHFFVLPAVIRKQFARFAPSGTFDAMIELHRKKQGSRLTYNGIVDVTDATVVYEKFKYPMHGVHGQIRFNDERVDIISLRGTGSDGASAVMNGSIAPPAKGAAVHLTISATNVPIDQALYQALAPRHRLSLDTFMNQPGQQRFIDLGLLQTAQQHAAQAGPDSDIADTDDPDKMIADQPQLEPPVFDLGGTIDLDILIERTYGLDQKFRNTVTVRPAPSVNLLLSYWPYPLTAVGGQLVIKGNQIAVQDIVLRGLNETTGRVTGTIRRDPNQPGKTIPELKVVGYNIPYDDYLLASCPGRLETWLRQLQLHGIFDVSGEIYSESTGQTDYRIDAHLRNGRAKPFGQMFPIDHLDGSIILHRDHAKIDGMQGRYGQVNLAISSDTHWPQGQVQTSMTLAAQDLTLDDKIVDFLTQHHPQAQQIHRLFETHHPDGVLDAQLTCQVTNGQPSDYSLRLQPHKLSFDLRGHHVSLEDSQGHIMITPQGIELEQWAASFGAGSFIASGTVGVGDNPSYDLTFDAQADHICDTTRSVLPDTVIAVIDGLQLDGVYHVQGAKLSRQAGDDHNNPTMRFDAKAHLTDAVATVGVPITQMNGDLTIALVHRDHTAWPRLDLQLNAQSLQAADRLISPFFVSISNGKQSDRLTIQDFSGLCYGGELFGSGEILLNTQGLYRMWLTLEDVELDPFLNPQDYPLALPDTQSDQPENPPPAKKNTLGLTGVLSANLAIEGSSVNPTLRRGRGEMLIEQANLYKLPIALTMMQIANLSLPTSQSFSEATASYLLDKDLVLFDAIRFAAPTIEIVGSGAMQYSTLGLDLQMFTRNPAAKALGPLSDLLAVFKDELMSIHVTGTLTDPKAKLRSFRGIKRSWTDIFGSKPKPDQTQLADQPANDTTSGQ